MEVQILIFNVTASLFLMDGLWILYGLYTLPCMSSS